MVTEALEAARPQSTQAEVSAREANLEGPAFTAFLEAAVRDGEIGEKIRALFAEYALAGAKRGKSLGPAEAAEAETEAAAEAAEEAEAAAAPKEEKEANGGREAEGRKGPALEESVRHALLRLAPAEGLPAETELVSQGLQPDGESPREGGKSGKAAEALEGLSVLAQPQRNAPLATGGELLPDGAAREAAESGARAAGATAEEPKGGGRPKLVVVDLRGEPAGDPKQESLGVPGSDTHRNGPRREIRTEEGVRFFSRSLSGERAGLEGGRESAASSAKSAAPRFQEMLRNEVVRHSTIILKEGGGELRLILKPESLGRVRINLNLNNDHIAGRIIVENSSVKDMFESNLQNLQNAFKSEGYASASLEVSVGAGGGQTRGDGEALEPKRKRPWEAAAEFENSVPVVQDLPGDDWIINLTV